MVRQCVGSFPHGGLSTPQLLPPASVQNDYSFQRVLTGMLVPKRFGVGLHFYRLGVALRLSYVFLDLW